MVTGYGQIQIVRTSKDKGMLTYVRSILKAGNIHLHHTGPVKKRGGESYRLDITRAEDCVRVMDLLWDRLIEERKEKWRSSYEKYKNIREVKKEKSEVYRRRIKEIDVKPEFVIEEEEKESMLELEELMKEAKNEKEKE